MTSFLDRSMHEVSEHSVLRVFIIYFIPIMKSVAIDLNIEDITTHLPTQCTMNLLRKMLIFNYKQIILVRT